MKKLRCTIFNFLEFCECISFAIWHLNSLIISGGSIWLAHTLGQFLIRGLTLNQIMLKYLLSPWRRKEFLSFIYQLSIFFSIHLLWSNFKKLHIKGFSFLLLYLHTIPLSFVTTTNYMMYHIISGPTFDAAHTANNFTLVIQHLSNYCQSQKLVQRIFLVYATSNNRTKIICNLQRASKRGNK